MKKFSTKSIDFWVSVLFPNIVETDRHNWLWWNLYPGAEVQIEMQQSKSKAKLAFCFKQESASLWYTVGRQIESVDKLRKRILCESFFFVWHSTQNLIVRNRLKWRIYKNCSSENTCLTRFYSSINNGLEGKCNFVALSKLVINYQFSAQVKKLPTTTYSYKVAI